MAPLKNYLKMTVQLSHALVYAPHVAAMLMPWILLAAAVVVVAAVENAFVIDSAIVAEVYFDVDVVREKVCYFQTLK